MMLAEDSMLFRKSRVHKNQVHFVATLKGVVGMLRDPTHTESVFDIEDGLRDIEGYDLAIRHVATDADVAAMMKERYLRDTPDVDQLASLPTGTLGHEFARHIREHGFDPDYYRKLEVESDKEWVMMRMRQTHDIWHVVTGIGIDPIGELSLKAFELAQTRRPLAAVITAGGVVRYLMRDADQLGDVLEGLSVGYRLGCAARPFLAQRWEEGWQRPLADWRTALDVDLERHRVGSIDRISALQRGARKPGNADAASAGAS
jgi:ubiquinone biosynthesis protein Coq4